MQIVERRERPPSRKKRGKGGATHFGKFRNLKRMGQCPSYSGLNLSGSSTSQVCGDDRDQLTPEYVSYGADFFPTCFQFVSSLQFSLYDGSVSPHFSFQELNVSDINYPDHANWALLQKDLLTGLESTRSNYGTKRSRLTVHIAAH